MDLYVIGDPAKYVKFLMAAISRHSLLNLGKSRTRAQDRRAAAGLRAEALRMAGTLTLLASPTASGQLLAALPTEGSSGVRAVRLSLRPEAFVRGSREDLRPRGSG